MTKMMNNVIVEMVCSCFDAISFLPEHSPQVQAWVLVNGHFHASLFLAVRRAASHGLTYSSTILLLRSVPNTCNRSFQEVIRQQQPESAQMKAYRGCRYSS